MQNDVFATAATMGSSRSARAAQRALADRQRLAIGEVERILDAALSVIERVAPASPRVSDIVAAAGTSNQTFYRYFAGKDDLILAVMERGTARVVSYVEHQMGKEHDPGRKIGRWIEGVLTQAADRRAARTSRAAFAQLERIPGSRAREHLETLAPIRDLLVAPLTDAGSRDPVRDAGVIHEATFGIMRRHLWQATTPTNDDRAHLVAFCMRAIGR